MTSVLLMLLVAAGLLLLIVAGYRRLNRWYIARRNGWRTGWDHVARKRREGL